MLKSTGEDDLVTLVATDGTRVDIERGALAMSNTLRDLDSSEGIVCGVGGPALLAIARYCTYHLHHQPDSDDAELWDASFCTDYSQIIYDLILGANYLDIPPLLHLLTTSMSRRIAGKTPREIRAMFAK